MEDRVVSVLQSLTYPTGDWATVLGGWPCEHECGQGADIEGERDAEERVLEFVAFAGALRGE